MTEKRDTDLVCTACRWRAGHAPDCPRKDEPWPTIDMSDQKENPLSKVIDRLANMAMLHGTAFCKVTFDGKNFNFTPILPEYVIVTFEKNSDDKT